MKPRLSDKICMVLEDRPCVPSAALMQQPLNRADCSTLVTLTVELSHTRQPLLLHRPPQKDELG